MTPEELIKLFKVRLQDELEPRRQTILSGQFNDLADMKYHCGYLLGIEDTLESLENFYTEKLHKDEG